MIDIKKLLNDIEETQLLLPDISVDCALILGSGWSSVIADLPTKAILEYSDIPALGATNVVGHAGRLVIAEWSNLNVAIFQGRRHWYEGIGWNPILFPIMLSKALGAKVVLQTNAAGGIREDLTPGTFMVVDDHINMMSTNPLIGPHHPELGPRFPDQTEVYSKNIRTILDQAGVASKTKLPHGVYLATSGPTYETPTEIKAFRAMGADAVGMSTIPESIIANSIGMQVGAISCITNSAAGISKHHLSHEEVIETTDNAKVRMRAFLNAFFTLLKKEL
ncbi:MAG: purine-nucleoside phosphorylase [Kiritimatiellae bacterium]|nr:purine-nucleoside phosphorylase [Kiritimatiellia bacterium]